MKDVVGCCSLERAPAAADAALQCIIQMTAAPALQVTNLLPFAALLPPCHCCLSDLCTTQLAAAAALQVATLNPCPFIIAAVMFPFAATFSPHCAFTRHSWQQHLPYWLLKLCLDNIISQSIYSTVRSGEPDVPLQLYTSFFRSSLLFHVYVCASCLASLVLPKLLPDVLACCVYRHRWLIAIQVLALFRVLWLVHQ